ncbi:MAG: hypothetical protein M0038_16525 [Pseudomonadota bacterium]|jgi:hypothetical protein|nr:hypothetical protein [Pseudomonadota bacterium]
MTRHESRSSEADWVLLESCADPLTAQVLAGRLQADGIPAQVRAFEPIPGLEQRAEVHVPRPWLERARESLEAQRPSEEELTALALAAAPKTPGSDGSG